MSPVEYSWSTNNPRHEKLNPSGKYFPFTENNSWPHKRRSIWSACGSCNAFIGKRLFCNLGRVPQHGYTPQSFHSPQRFHSLCDPLQLRFHSSGMLFTPYPCNDILSLDLEPYIQQPCYLYTLHLCWDRFCRKLFPSVRVDRMEDCLRWRRHIHLSQCHSYCRGQYRGHLYFPWLDSDYASCRRCHFHGLAKTSVLYLSLKCFVNRLELFNLMAE